MYAPVALRCRSYGATLSARATDYLETVLKDPILGQWLAAAELEPWVIPKSEVGQSA
jgi:glutathione S-transferase